MVTKQELNEARDEFVALINQYTASYTNTFEPDEEDERYWDEGYETFDEEAYERDYSEWEKTSLSVYSLAGPILDAIDGTGWHSSQLTCSF